MRLLVINGPNLNLLGHRDGEHYGQFSLSDIREELTAEFSDHQIDFRQSNQEGDIIDWLQEASDSFEGVVLNAGGYTHTSVAISDALEPLKVPVVEVHISNVQAREPFRHVSLLAKHCEGVISGFGLESYRLAILHLLRIGL